MKKIIRYIILSLLIFCIAFVYYYLALPAVNIHSIGSWFFLLFALLVGMGIHVFIKNRKKLGIQGNVSMLDFSPVKIWGVILIAGIIILIVGSVLSSPIINSKKYQALMQVEKRSFQDDIGEADYSQIPILDKASATIIGERKMGSMVDMVSQFEVGTDYTQINYNGIPVRVTPLVYASTIKWLTNHKDGIPAYLMIDMATQDTEVIKLEEGIHYSKSELFQHNIYRHLRFGFPTYIFDDSIYFEIDESGTPYWVCPVKKFNIGLFGGETIGRVVLCNAITGEFIDYAVEDVPQWVDKVYSAELLMELFDYHGTLVNGYWNSVLSQKDCLQSTDGYNYIALDDDVWVYTGVTSVSGDQSNVGFVLMNQRTMETRYYEIEGAIENSAMSSAEGQVQHLGYEATFPLLLNIKNEPTYLMALKDEAGLVKLYAMVNVQKYQLVATGDTVKECEKNYGDLLTDNGIETTSNIEYETITDTIDNIYEVVIEGTSHFYLTLENEDTIFDIDLSNEELLSILFYSEKDRITLSYESGEVLNSVKEIGN